MAHLCWQLIATASRITIHQSYKKDVLQIVLCNGSLRADNVSSSIQLVDAL